jgi:hypothetical protein
MDNHLPPLAHTRRRKRIESKEIPPDRSPRARLYRLSSSRSQSDFEMNDVRNPIESG